MELPEEPSVPNDVPAVRLAPGQWVSPTLLNTYAICPYRVRLQYIDRVLAPPRYDHFLVQGSLAHSLLKHAAQLIARRQPEPSPEKIYEMAIRRLHERNFPTVEAMEGQARQITRWVRTGIAHLDRKADYLLIEKPRHRPFNKRDPDSDITMTFRPDLVLQREDDAGSFIEVIDYKTGKRREESDVPVISRFILNSLLEEQMPNAWQMRVRFTFIWLDIGEVETIDLDAAYCSKRWAGILRDIDRLLNETGWKPAPSILCHYCPFHENACTAYVPGLSDGNPVPAFHGGD
ncbi:MAG TPA: PD-(D/E)XK nuclease family protein [Thermomicrobiales bacterium]|nr:PD-(D/E)XK nuclease family protein [Thermomicrobiales bacterium]